MLLVKPIYQSIIDYNIACCNQQLNKLKVCDKLLGQSIQALLEDITNIEIEIDNIEVDNQKKKQENVKIINYYRNLIKSTSQKNQQNLMT